MNRGDIVAFPKGFLKIARFIPVSYPAQAGFRSKTTAVPLAETMSMLLITS